VSLTDWIDKKLVAIAEDKINSVAMAVGKQTLTLVRKDNGDWVEEGKEVALDKNGFTTAISNLTALVTQVLVEKASSEKYPTAPTVEVIVNQKEGEPMVIKFYGGESTAKVTSSTRTGEYVVATSVMDSFKIKAADLKPAPSPTPSIEPTK
jgi:hypothetical protein